MPACARGTSQRRRETPTRLTVAEKHVDDRIRQFLTPNQVWITAAALSHPVETDRRSRVDDHYAAGMRQEQASHQLVLMRGAPGLSVVAFALP